MKTEDLYLEYARVIKMCEGTKVNPWECVKRSGLGFKEHPRFNLGPDEYTFAVGIVENKPVFVRDTVYSITTPYYKYVIENCHMARCDELDLGARLQQFNWEFATWNKPKRTFIFNGVELNCPVQRITAHKTEFLSGHYAYWDNAFDHNGFSSALQGILTEARDK